jgi:Concanavalin A-like lectin/glucanases superfamily
MLTRRHFLAGATTLAATPEIGLVGHWKLEGDVKDSSGLGNHGENRGAELTSNGAKFNGRSGYVEIPDRPSLRLGAGDFTIAARIYTERDLDDVIGDIVSKYDRTMRRGFTFNVKTNAVTFSQANYRHLHFGIDNGRTGEWTDCGRPGNCIYAMGLIAFEGSLYAGTCESGKEEAGHVYRYGGGPTWVDCGAPDKANSISSMAVLQGKLYVGSTRYNLGGSSLPPSPNENPGGRVYRYNGDGRWTSCGRLGESVSISGMAVYGGKLYASSLYQPAGTFCYEGGQKWIPCGTPGGKRVEALAVYNGGLYGTGYDGGEIYRYEGGANWSTVGRLPDTTQTYGFAIHEGRFYVSTWPAGRVFRYDGDNDWVDCGRLGEEKEVMGMAVYNGKLYAGTLPLAEVYRYEMGKTWTRTGQLDRTPDVRYRRAWSMAVYRGKLFCGTLPSGRVYSLEAGRSVTHDHELRSGWRRLAAVRSGRKLKLYVDGRLAATSGAFDPTAFDISNDRSLKIGFGDHDYFNGIVRDVRLYSRALSESEIRT